MYGNNNNRQSNRSSSSSAAAAAKFKQTNTNWKPKPKIVMDGPLDSASSSRKDNSSVSSSLVEESFVENEAFGVKDLKTIVKSLDDNNDCVSNMVKQVCDKCPMDDSEDHGSSVKLFDICPKKVHAGVVLKTPSNHQSNPSSSNHLLNPKQRFHWTDHWIALLIVKRTNIHYLLKALFFFLYFIFFIFYFFYFYFFVEETCVENVASGVNNLKMILRSLEDEDDAFKKGKQLCDKHQKDDGKDHGASIICPKRVSSVPKIKRSSLVEESLVENEAFGVKDLKMIPKPLDDNHACISNTVKQVCDKSRMDGSEDHGLSTKPFDICPKKVHAGVVLKKPLHVINKERRNQKNRGKSIDLLRSGMVLLKNYVSIEDQIRIVKTCRDLGVGEGGFYQPGFREGTKLHLKMMCLGKNWDPESKLYSGTRPFDNAKPPGIPDMFHDMVKKAIQDSNAHIKNVNPTAYSREVIPSMSPDLCIVNFYSKSGKLGLHQDKDESWKSLKEGLPVVSFSIGDSAEFLYGDTRGIDKADKVILESGDVLIYGGKSRHVFHGVPSIHPDTTPSLLQEATDMRPGRLNLSFRQF